MNRFEYANFNDNEFEIAMPNEIFADFKKAFPLRNHASFAFSYYYFVTYLYRYNKYVVNDFTQDEVKKFLGYAPTNKSVNAIIKRGGILDAIGYTETKADYPVFVEVDDNNIPHFQTIHDVKDEYPELVFLNEKNFKIKFPVKAFHRMNNDFYDGTYYDKKDTFGIRPRTFIQMMESQKLGTTAFYIYGYIKYNMTSRFGNRFVQSYEMMGDALGLSEKTVIKYISEMEAEHIVKVTHKNFWQNSEGEPNLYELLL